MSGIIVEDNETQNITISGKHQLNYTDSDVSIVWIENSTIPFVISQFFDTFPNIETFFMRNCGLKRIQSRAVQSARKLWSFTAFQNRELRTIEAAAFAGASNLGSLQLLDNAIENLHEHSFAGLNRLESINLNNNRVRVLPPNIFRPLVRFNRLQMNSNQLEVLDGNLFANNNRMVQVGLNSNRIKAIGRSFLQPLQNHTMSLMFLVGNECVNAFFSFLTMESEAMDRILAPCYDNYDKFN